MVSDSTRLKAPWLIVGAGAIGKLLYCRLYQQGITVALRGRRPLPRTLAFQPFPDSDVQHIPCQADDGYKPLAIACICTKAQDVTAAVEDILPRLDDNSLLLLCHNGLGVIERLAPLLPPALPVVALSLTHGAWCQDEARLCHSGLGDSRLGLLRGQLTDSLRQGVIHDLNQALPPVYWHPDIWPVLWQKLCINALINPLTALHQIPNGQLLNNQFRPQLRQLANELALLARHCGLPFSAEALYTRAIQVARNTAANYSSMNRDLALGRTPEIDAICGYLLTKARHHRLTMPTLSALTNKLKRRFSAG